MTLPPQVLSPLDGRYREAAAPLGEFLSEAGLNRARCRVEVEWIIFLAEQRLFGSTPLTADQQSALRKRVADFGQAD
jgi:adenylosuccinate lyase